MDLWKKPALKLIVEVVWTADCQSDTHTSLWRAHTHAHAALTHPSQQIMCSLLLITPRGLIHSIYRFRFPRRVVFIFSLRVQSLIWFVKSCYWERSNTLNTCILPLSVFKLWLDYLRHNLVVEELTNFNTLQVRVCEYKKTLYYFTKPPSKRFVVEAWNNRNGCWGTSKSIRSK